jgi:hypothetical protein
MLRAATATPTLWSWRSYGSRKALGCERAWIKCLGSRFETRKKDLRPHPPCYNWPMKTRLSPSRHILLAAAWQLCLAHAVAFCATQTEVAQREWIQEQNVPRWVGEVFAAKKLNQQYEFSFHLNPFYLRGDFNGDKIPDVAIIVKEKKSGKVGIAIFHGAKREVLVLGAGRKFGNGVDDFVWMNIWGVYPKRPVSRGAGEGNPPTLRGEALLVEKAESASALIYWDGKEYRWYQQGD